MYTRRAVATHGSICYFAGNTGPDSAVSKEINSSVFPGFTAISVPLPIGKGTIERSFSTMNKILCSERCRLLPSHCCQLMQLSIERQALPDVRESTEQERAAMEHLLKSAYDNWLVKPRRGID